MDDVLYTLVGGRLALAQWKGVDIAMPTVCSLNGSWGAIVYWLGL